MKWNVGGYVNALHSVNNCWALSEQMEHQTHGVGTPRGHPQAATNALFNVNEFSMKNSLTSFYARILVA
jgi:hypothetical protein